MSKPKEQTFVCPICKQTRSLEDERPGEMVHGTVKKLIQEQHPDWGDGDPVCFSCLSDYRSQYVEDVLEAQRGELSSVEDAVIESLKEHEVLARNVEVEFEQKLSFGQKLADKVAEFGGSWRFIIMFASVLVIWIIINSALLFFRPFDPYPFIFLNLVLSCLAAVQAPIIMMSQNRQEAKDRARGQHDYQVNLKAEIEIRQLHIKLDQLINNWWQRLLEIQQIQMDIMADVARNQAKPNNH